MLEKAFECRNLRSAYRDPDVVSQLVEEELGKHFLIGPYLSPSFANYRVNPLGLVEL